MDIPIDVIAKKAILAIIFLSVLLILCGALFFYLVAAFELYETLPFAIGVVFSVVLNVVKVMLLKRTVKKVANMSSAQAGKQRFYIHHFSQLGLTIAVLFIAVTAPDHIVNVAGTIIGLFTFKLAMHLMQIYAPKDEKLPDAVSVEEGDD